MTTERNAFVSSMAKLTNADKAKNLKATQTIFSLANILGEHLAESWFEILKVVLMVQRVLENKGTQIKNNDNGKNDKIWQELELSIDRIFANTVNLSSSAILHFFKALCKVLFFKTRSLWKKSVYLALLMIFRQVILSARQVL